MRCPIPPALSAGLLCLALALPLAAVPQEDAAELRSPETRLGFSFGRFAPSDEVFRQVYGENGWLFGLSLGRDLAWSGRFVFSVGLEAGRFSRSGLSTVTALESRLRLVTIRLNPEMRWTGRFLSAWVGAGPDLIFHTEDSAWGIQQGSTFGFHLAAGIDLHPARAPMIRAYWRWSKAGRTDEGVTVDLGGTEIGLALVFRFGL